MKAHPVKGMLVAAVATAACGLSYVTYSGKKTDPVLPSVQSRAVVSESVSKIVYYAYGQPVSKEDVTILKNIGYVSAYSDSRKNPLWVAFRLDYPIRHDDYSRNHTFIVDKRTSSGVSSADYESTGFSRGHMAPSVTMYAYYGETAEAESFFMSNAVPQYQLNNVGCWKSLELLTGHGKENYVATYRTVYVVCGPIFPEKPETISQKKIEVPSYLYKILIRNTETVPSFLPFITPNVNDKDANTRKLDSYLDSVDNVQKKTSIVLFPALPAKFKKLLTEKPEKIWDLSK